MPSYKYLVVGGGMAADAAVRGIRQVDPDGSIGLIGEETHPPYNRPPLSKGLWKGQRAETIWRTSANNEAIEHLGHRAESLDPAAKQVVDDRGTIYHYHKLLLVTGGTPRRLANDDPAVIYFRTLDDYHRLRTLAKEGNNFVVIGGGFIGAEIAAALTEAGKQVTMVFAEDGIGGGRLPADLALFLNGYYEQRGVRLVPRDRVAGVRADDGGVTVLTERGARLMADGVVAGIGIEPNVSLARDAGLAIDQGIAVDASLQTSHPDIFAAGDAASFPDPVLQRRMRVEHEDNANRTGQLAGQAMAGQPASYNGLPMFYSDLFDLGYEAVGELDARLETLADWKEPFREGIVFYLGEGRVRGVLLWNVKEMVDWARERIAVPGPFRREDLWRGREPEGGAARASFTAPAIANECPTRRGGSSAEHLAGQVVGKRRHVEAERFPGGRGMGLANDLAGVRIPPLDTVVAGRKTGNFKHGGTDRCRRLLLDHDVPPRGLGVEEPKIDALGRFEPYHSHLGPGHCGRGGAEPGLEGNVGKEGGQGLVVAVGALLVELLPPPEMGRARRARKGRSPEGVVEVREILVLFHERTALEVVLGQAELGEDRGLLGAALRSCSTCLRSTSTSSWKPSLDAGRR